MEKRVFQTINEEVSLLGFGGMRFPTKDGEIDYELSSKMVDIAYKNGVNYFDTAYPYHDGKSELFFGKAMKKYDRKSFFLATKMPLWAIKSREDAERIFNEQLEKLQTEYIDFYLFHAVDKGRWEQIKNLDLISFCEEKIKEGKIRHLGFSFHDEYDVFEEIITARKWDFVQVQLNYIDEREQAGLKGYELTKKLDIPVIIMEPVKGGTLARLPDEVDKLYKDYNPDASTASWAMRWCGSLDNVKLILSGMSSREQVLDNLKTFSNFSPLNEEEKALVNKVAKVLLSREKNPCTDCRYCLPCPAGVNIPANFDRWNKYHVYGDKENAVKRWTDFKDEEKAKNCVKCGLCETKCPQKINIREDLAALQAELDGLCNL